MSGAGGCCAVRRGCGGRAVVMLRPRSGSVPGRWICRTPQCTGGHTPGNSTHSKHICSQTHLGRTCPPRQASHAETIRSLLRSTLHTYFISDSCRAQAIHAAAWPRHRAFGLDACARPAAVGRTRLALSRATVLTFSFQLGVAPGPPAESAGGASLAANLHSCGWQAFARPPPSNVDALQPATPIGHAHALGYLAQNEPSSPACVVCIDMVCINKCARAARGARRGSMGAHALAGPDAARS